RSAPDDGGGGAAAEGPEPGCGGGAEGGEDLAPGLGHVPSMPRRRRRAGAAGAVGGSVGGGEVGGVGGGAVVEPGGEAVEVVEPGELASGAEEGHDDLAIVDARAGDEAVAGGLGVSGLSAGDVPLADDERLVGGAVVDVRVVILGDD